MSGELLGVYNLKSQHSEAVDTVELAQSRQAEMVRSGTLDPTKSKPSTAHLAMANEASTVPPHSSSRCD